MQTQDCRSEFAIYFSPGSLRIAYPRVRRKDLSSLWKPVCPAILRAVFLLEEHTGDREYTAPPPVQACLASVAIANTAGAGRVAGSAGFSAPRRSATSPIAMIEW